MRTSDFKVYYQLVSNPLIASDAQFQMARNKQKARQLLKDDLRGGYSYAILVDSKMIGVLSLYATIGKAGQPDHRQLELAYMILPSQQGRGYMTRALSRMIEQLRPNSSVHQLVALVNENNQASRAVLRRNHFHNYHSVLDMFSGRDDLVYQLNLDE